MIEDTQDPGRREHAMPQTDDAAQPAWSAYQEDVANFFRGLGLEAETNVRLEGARGVHDIDVFVGFQSAGIEVTWVVECKQWSRPIPKDRVLVLAGVMADIGADRGLIVAESGFQAGAIRATANTNITLTSLEDLAVHTEYERTQIQVAAVRSRIAALNELATRCWLWAPPSTPTGGIDINEMIEFAGEIFELTALVLPRVVADSYPIVVGSREPTLVSNAVELVEILEPRLDALQQRAEALSRIASSAAARVRSLVDNLASGTADLIAAGRALPDDLHSSDSAIQVTRFVAAMRRIGAPADELKTAAPAEARTELGKLMRHLIDNTYLVTEAAQLDWDLEEAAVGNRVARVRYALQESGIALS
jgi:hypothetical protein